MIDGATTDRGSGALLHGSAVSTRGRVLDDRVNSTRFFPGGFECKGITPFSQRMHRRSQARMIESHGSPPRSP